MLVACDRKRAGSRETRPPPTVYLVYYHSESTLYSYSFYALEIAGAENGQSKSLPKPLFRFNEKTGPVAPGFVALGSKIYVIGGSTSAFEPGKDKFSLDTYVFDTARPLPAGYEAADPTEFLKKGPRLNAPKLGPILVTFDGRIYAFPRCFSSHSPPSPKCEMLNPESGLWVTFLDPPLLDLHESDQSIRNYTVDGYVVHDGVFFASTPRGIYSLNLSNFSGWRHILSLGGISRLPFVEEAVCIDGQYFAVVENGQKLALCKYDKELGEEKDLLDLQSGHE